MKKWYLDTHIGVLLTQLGIVFAGSVIVYLGASIVEQISRGGIDGYEGFALPFRLTLLTIVLWLILSIAMIAIFFCKHQMRVEYGTDCIYLYRLLGKCKVLGYGEIKQWGCLIIPYYFAFHIVKEKKFLYLAEEEISESQAKEAFKKRRLIVVQSDENLAIKGRKKQDYIKQRGIWDYNNKETYKYYDKDLIPMINIYTAVKQSQGDTVRPMLLNVLGVSINLILDPLFLMKFGWGISGAALATLLAKIPSAVLALYVLTRKGQLIQINFKGFRFEKTKMLSILKIGLPTAIGGSTMQFGFLLMTKNVNAYGTTATTAYGIGNKINSIITMPANGIGSAISTIVGQNFGAGNIKRTDQSYHIALRIGAVFLFVCGMILSRRFIAEPIVRFFTSDDAVVPLATDFLSIMAICCWTNAFYNVTQGLFQGCGHTMITMMVDASRIWVFRFLTLWVCASLLHMGVESIWYAVVVSNATSALILYILYWTGIWKHRTVKIEKSAGPDPSTT